MKASECRDEPPHRCERLCGSLGDQPTRREEGVPAALVVARMAGRRPESYRVGRRDAHGVDGHPSVLVRARRLGQVVRGELVELIRRHG